MDGRRGADGATGVGWVASRTREMYVVYERAKGDVAGGMARCV